MFKDLLLDADGDLLIDKGDFVVGDSDARHVEDIIESFPGEWKQFPSMGVGIMTFLKSENGKAAVALIQSQLQADGYSINAIDVKNDNGNLIVDFPNKTANGKVVPGIQRNL